MFFIKRGYLNGNHFVYRGEEPILIDTGYVSDFNKTAVLIETLGVNLSNIRLIINTHCHCDHIGGNNLIQKKSGCDIACHTIGKYYIDSHDDWSTWWKYYNQEADFFSCTKELKDGDIVTVGSYNFKIIHTPGHASDGIVLYNKKNKILLSSDTLWENNISVVTMRIEGSRTLFSMLESLEKIEALNVKMVYPGHGKPFADVKAAISKSKKIIKSYMNNKEKLGAGLLKRIIVYTLLMHKMISEDTFFDQLMNTYWFKETIELYFDGEYETIYNKIIDTLLTRGLIKRKNNTFITTVTP